MKQRDPNTGKFVRTTPDYKAMYEESMGIIEAQGRKISQLTADLHNAQQNAFVEKQNAQLYWNRMGSLRQWWFTVSTRWFD